MSLPPPPLDDPTVDILHCPPLRWGLLGCGRVSHDFCQALKHLPTASVVACATNDGKIDRPQAFADTHKITTAYKTYQELVQDPDVDIVYVGNVHSFRRRDGELCITANKHVLLEKPMACSAQDAEYLIQLAQKHKVFCMEGMWTRFFPAVEQARRLVLGGYEADGITFTPGALGAVVSVASDFNFNATDNDDHYPSSFVFQRKLGGGASLLVAPYPIAACTLFFEGREPDQIHATGQVDKPTGVDLQAALVVSFPPTSDQAPALNADDTTENTPKLPGAGIATMMYGMLGESEEVTKVVGTKGRLTLQSPCHCPTTLNVVLKDYGRGQAASEESYHYPLPKDTPEIEQAGGFHYPNSAGFSYEAAAVARCIAAGKLEAPQYTLAETMVEMRILDEARKQLGVQGIDDD
jgi:dihydrodiol dehydrogenase / D-xylose 1-dehydrogenase (NADP)